MIILFISYRMVTSKNAHCSLVTIALQELKTVSITQKEHPTSYAQLLLYPMIIITNICYISQIANL